MRQHPPQRRRLVPARPPEVTYVVGDVHGQAALYDRLEAEIRADAQAIAPGAPVLVVLAGDMIDRGPASATMLQRLAEGTSDGLQRLGLLGNHEAMFLAFLEHPDGKAPWLALGGRETLLSYGAAPDPRRGFDLPTARLQRWLDQAVPDRHEALLRDMPVSLRLPGFLICHAGVAPARALAEQRDEDLIWGTPGDLDAAPCTAPAVADLSAHGLKVVHGHAPQETAGCTPRRVAVDTGAYATGRLSAVRLRSGEAPAFVQVDG